MTVWIQIISASTFFELRFSLLFFFFFGSAAIVDFVNCEQCIRALFTVPQITLFNHFFIFDNPVLLIERDRERVCVCVTAASSHVLDAFENQKCLPIFASSSTMYIHIQIRYHPPLPNFYLQQRHIPTTLVLHPNNPSNTLSGIQTHLTPHTHTPFLPSQGSQHFSISQPFFFPSPQWLSPFQSHPYSHL